MESLSLWTLILGATGTLTGLLALLLHYVLRDKVNFKAIIEYCIIKQSSNRRYAHIIRVMNNGRHVQIEEVGFFLTENNKASLPYYGCPIPYSLDKGDHKVHEINMERLREHVKSTNLKVKSVYARDSHNNIRRGKIPKTLKDIIYDNR